MPLSVRRTCAPMIPAEPIPIPPPGQPNAVAPAAAEPLRQGWPKWRYRFTQATWWHWSYLGDYVLILLLFALGLFIARYLIEPFHRFLPPGSTDVTYPSHKNIIPVWLLMVLSVAVPVAAFGLYQIWGRSLHDFHHATLGVLEGFGFAIFFTYYLKLYCGKYRPNFLQNQTSDGRQAFPSGHASIAMQSGVFLSLWLAGKLGLFKKQGGHVWQQFIVFLPIIGAALIAFSRTRDYHHDFVDTTAGVVLGGSIAIFNYFLKYPPLWKRNCEIPKRRWYEPHRNAAQWSARYAAADANVPADQQL